MAAAALLALPRPAPAHRERPPPAHTGGFGEPTCVACHHGDPVDAPGGALELAVPATFAAGTVHEIEVRLTRSGLRRAGFQLSARWAEGPRAGAPAGALLVDGPLVQLVAAHTPAGVSPAAPPGSDHAAVRELSYATHTEAGTVLAAAGEARWRLRWRAPPRPHGPVVFHAAANASDDDDSELGDFVYTASAVSRPHR